MDNNYVTLFKEVAKTTSLLAEQVMEYNKNNNDEKGLETATIMRDDFNKLYNKMNIEGFSPEILTIDDYRRFLVGTLIVVNNINNKISNEQKAVQNYNTTIIPKLQRILDECKTQEEINKLSAELFVINT